MRPSMLLDTFLLFGLIVCHRTLIKRPLSRSVASYLTRLLKKLFISIVISPKHLWSFDTCTGIGTVNCFSEYFKWPSTSPLIRSFLSQSCSETGRKTVSFPESNASKIYFRSRKKISKTKKFDHKFSKLPVSQVAFLEYFLFGQAILPTRTGFFIL